MPTSKITVQRNGQPALNIKVTPEYTGITQIGFTTPAYTDPKGVAYVSHSSTGRANIYVNGAKKGAMETPGEDIIYL